MRTFGGQLLMQEVVHAALEGELRDAKVVAAENTKATTTLRNRCTKEHFSLPTRSTHDSVCFSCTSRATCS